MIVEGANIKDFVELAKLSIKTERQTYLDKIPRYLHNVSGIEGRTKIWKTALSDEALRKYILVARTPSGSIVGFLSGRPPGDDMIANLNGIYVLNEFQRMRIGRRLLAFFVHEIILQKTTAMRSIAPKQNTIAREFFTWSGALEVAESSSKSSLYPTAMTYFVWNNLEQLLKYLTFVD